MNYYLLRQDISVPEKWVLGDVRHVNNWNFIDPPVNFMEPGTYALDVRFDGREVDYSLAGYASVPVLSLKAYKALSGLPEVDEPYCNVVFEPVRFENKKLGGVFLMIIETQFDCVDEKIQVIKNLRLMILSGRIWRVNIRHSPILLLILRKSAISIFLE